MDWIEVCQDCYRSFSIVEVGGESGPRDREAIQCPHCKKIWGYAHSSGIFLTSGLTEEQMGHFSEQQRKEMGRES